MEQKILFQINTALLNSVHQIIWKSKTHITVSSVFNIDSNTKNLIITEQKIIISE